MAQHALRIRTITLGLELHDASRAEPIERAIGVLKRAHAAFQSQGYEVQTLRIVTEPFIAGLDRAERERALVHLKRLDARLTAEGVILSVGPVLTEDRDDLDLAAWGTQLVRETRTISFSAVVSSSAQGVHRCAVKTAARIASALTHALPEGFANFRFAAAANIPAGTPFFPVAWHRGASSLAIGLESASVVQSAFESMRNSTDAADAVREHLTAAARPIEVLAASIATDAQLDYLGIDTSPAPAHDRSIAAAIETLTGVPFGSAATLDACATITAALKSIDLKTCGYCGLMLPVLEDPLLALRAGEQRYGVRELLLYSSVCGTGLDVVPLPGDTPVTVLERLIRDVAALSNRLNKPLSARLLLVPGKRAGEIASFSDELLTDCVVMGVQ